MLSTANRGEGEAEAGGFSGGWGGVGRRLTPDWGSHHPSQPPQQGGGVCRVCDSIEPQQWSGTSPLMALQAAFRLITRMMAGTDPLLVALSRVLPLAQLQTSPSLAVKSISPAVI